MDEKIALAAVDASLETLEDGCRELREIFEAFVPLIESLRGDFLEAERLEAENQKAENFGSHG
jgi:hypothetical protein